MIKNKLNLQLFAEIEDCAMYEAKDGTIPAKENELILQDIMENSKTMQLAKYESMDSKEKEFTFFAKGPGAYWVGEGEKIQTSKAEWRKAKMVAKKLAVIIPCSREFLTYKKSNFFEIMRPKIAEAMYKKFDEATILNKDNPFPQSVEQSINATKATIDGPISYDNLLGLEDKLTDADHDVNAFISTKRNRSTLRNVKNVENGAVVETLYDRGANTLDGYPVVDLKAVAKGTIYAGDFDYMYYGIPFNLSYKIDESAQLSTITNPDGTPVNLFEQELVALRVTMDVAFMIVKDEAFARLGSAAATLGTLTVSTGVGSKSGDTKPSVTQSKGPENIYKYKIANEAVTVRVGESVKSWKNWDGSADITAETGKTITIVEATKDYEAVKAGSSKVTAQA